MEKALCIKPWYNELDDVDLVTLTDEFAKDSHIMMCVVLQLQISTDCL